MDGRLLCVTDGQLPKTARPGTLVAHEGSIKIYDWDHWVTLSAPAPKAEVVYPAGAPTVSWWDRPIVTPRSTCWYMGVWFVVFIAVAVWEVRKALRCNES